MYSFNTQNNTQFHYYHLVVNEPLFHGIIVDDETTSHSSICDVQSEMKCFLFARCTQQLHLQKVTNTVHNLWHYVTKRYYRKRSAEGIVHTKYKNAQLWGSNCHHLVLPYTAYSTAGMCSSPAK